MWVEIGLGVLDDVSGEANGGEGHEQGGGYPGGPAKEVFAYQRG